MPGRAPIAALRSACARRSAASMPSRTPRPTSIRGSASSTWRCRECPTSARRSRSAASYVDHRAQQQRSDLRPDHGAGGVLECGVAAQQPVGRPLSVFGTHHRHGGDGAGRRHARRHGNAGRVEAIDQRAPPGGSGRRQHGASHRLVAAGDDDRDQSRRRRFVVRVEARRGHFVADRCDRDAADRRAAGCRPSISAPSIRTTATRSRSTSICPTAPARRSR